MKAASTCFVCGGGPLEAATSSYLRCPGCGHEILKEGQAQTFMLNDVLDPAEHAKPDLIVRFQSSIVRRVMRKDGLLVDIGSGSGKFLFHNRAAFRSILGVEVTPENVRYSTEVLGLPVRASLPEDLGVPSVVTLWHSLEHIPTEALDPILRSLGAACDGDSRLVVSVPNSRSLQHRLLGEGYAYYDVPNHLHQFSPRSLDLLMRRYGFEEVESFFSPLYIAFGYAQGALNAVMPIHNYYYYRRKRGARFGLPPFKLGGLDLVNSALFLGAIPFALALSLVDLTLRDLRGVLTVCYRKTASRSATPSPPTT